MEVSSVDRYEAAFKEAVNARNTAVWVTLNPLANSNQKLIAELAIKNGLPSICARTDYAENGCLMAYGPGYSIEGRDGARYVDRILKGDQAGRPSGRAADQVRAGDQSQDREAARRDDSKGAAEPGRQADRMTRRRDELSPARLDCDRLRYGPRACASTGAANAKNAPSAKMASETRYT